MEKAHVLCPEEYSCRNFKIPARSFLYILGVIALIIAFPIVSLSFAMIWVLFANLATTSLRISAVIAWRNDRLLPVSLPDNYVSLSKHRDRPKVTILVPLFHEDTVLPRLIETLSNLDYPRESFEVKFLLEEVDNLTTAAIKKINLPDFIECLTIPKDWLQTKPKAMNYALPFCDGEIIGIYDAEDRPEPDQILKVVDHFMVAPADVACVQGYLDFYNSRHNWLARCFTMEYATWFRVILKGIQRLRIPIPLGGTTVFFRRDILEKIGGWDAHNVTEDADLGMRLARFGYRCEMVNTTTWEEANARPLPWVRQRSRWLKGYAITWATHMRNPLKLWRDLGFISFIGFQIIFLGGLSAFLAGPIFWALWLSCFSLPIIPISALPAGLWELFAATLIVGQVTMFTVMLLAIGNSKRKHLLPYFLALPFYWPLGTFAAYKAIAELFYAPFYWDKTAHGVTSDDHSPSASSRKRVS
ncbi:MAG: glycosyltransferase family 2 protein [Alphaproteobacteria bacterium]